MRYLSIFLCLAAVSSSAVADPAVLPGSVVLTGPRERQQLLVVDRTPAGITADLTATAKFVAADPKVAVVDAEGVVRPTGNGTTTVKATAGSRSADVRVTVSNFQNDSAPSFQNQIAPIMTRFGCNSGACHGALAGKGGFKLSLRGYDLETDHFTLTRQAGARRINLSAPAESLFLQKGTRTVPHGGGTRIGKDSPEATMILDWIRGGARPSTDRDAVIVSIDVEPKRAIVRPKDQLRLIVTARYSDGRTADVTRWSKFVSAESQTADIDEDGRIKVQGYGETAVSAVYENRVASAVISSPFPNTPDSAAIALPAGAGTIDRLVASKLTELRLPVSPICTDHEFIRRVYLDALGILPTPLEVEKFVADQAPNKRTALIDSLLERSEYVDYWAYKWSDLMLVSTRSLPQSGMWAFYRSIRKAVSDNTPWDRFSREIIESTGSSLDNGGGNFYVLHKDVADATESIAVTFMGMSITCARCHNHPLEKWTQDQYWSMANLFSRVSLKNGDRGGEVLLQSATTGDILHPRRETAMPPAPLDGKPLALTDSRDRRKHFTDWLTARDNPYFAKALVNRVWKSLMGRGLVESEDDLRETNPATNGPLFDALAREFVDDRYDVKKLIRKILTSSAYQRSSRPIRGNEADDRYYSHYLVRRLSGEVLLDALSQVTESPTKFNLVYTGVEGGTAATTNYPAGTRAMQLPDSRVASRFLDAFGRPDRRQTCSCERSQDSTVGQALMLSNGQTLNDKLRDPASAVKKWAALSLTPEQAVERLFRSALSRSPTKAEMKRMTAVMAEYGPAPQSRLEALEDLFWAVLTSREFVFNH